MGNTISKELHEINEYRNGKIYLIKSNKTNKIYIGSTTKTLQQRFTEHQLSYKCYNNELGAYTTSFKLLVHDDAVIELITNYSCVCKEDLEKKEASYIREYKQKGICVNRYIPQRTSAEYYLDNKTERCKYGAEYYYKNKEKISERGRQYYQKNKTNIAEYRQQYSKNNKEKIKQRSKKYRENNLENIKKKANEKILCDCGVFYTRCHKARHMKTTKHLSLVQ